MLMRSHVPFSSDPRGSRCVTEVARFEASGEEVSKATCHNLCQNCPVHPDDPLARTELTFVLGMAFQLVVAEFVRRLDAEGYADLRPAHGAVFQALRGGGATSTELAERLGVTKQAAGQMVADLEQRGYLRRVDHPDGGRRRLVVLTGKADDHMAVAGQVLYKLEGELSARLGEENLLQLRAALSQLIRELAGAELPPLRPAW
jgi:DNA-binding MarR family transcriptional regulator